VDASQVRTLLDNGSGTEVAFVPEKSAAQALAETLVALANTEGGTLLVGVTRAGSVRGVREPDALCDRILLAALSIVPPLVLPMPEQAQVRERTVVAVRIPPGLPSAYALDGQFLIREGPRNRPLRPAEIHRLMMQRGVIHFETQPPPGSTLDDLDWDRVRQYANRLEQLGHLAPQDVLVRRACLAEVDGDLYPTLAGLLLFGHSPSQWVHSAEITAVRYAGREMSDQFIREDIDGPLPDQIRKAEAFAQANTLQEVALEGLTREERPAYPGDVLREVIVNAAAHRDYTIQGEGIRILIFGDRIQVYSPGRLPGHVTVENIVEERFSRNPVIVQVLADMGFIERLGYGIDRMLRLLQDEGHPAPVFEETTAGFQVTIYARHAPPPTRRSRWAQLDLNPRQELALQYVTEHNRITNREYQKLCPDVSAETIRRDLSDLVHKDVLLRIGRKRATYYILKMPSENQDNEP
jgi:ATP-dependent DNA helicase RecG